MALNPPSCSKCVDSKFDMVKNGNTKSGKQRYICKTCGKTQVEYYTYNAYESSVNGMIKTLIKEGCGIRSTARILKISPTTLLSRIVRIAAKILQPSISKGKSYEVDELRTFVKKRLDSSGLYML